MEATATLDRFVERMPKVELHIHLEGAVRPATVLDLARRHGQPLAALNAAGLADFFAYRDFPQFIECYKAVGHCLRTPDAFARIVTELAEDAAAQNIRYLEVHFNPEPHVRKRGLDFHDLLAAMNDGRRAAREAFGVELCWIADGVRDAESGPASVTRTVDWLVGLDATAGVVALGLGGNEVGYPPVPFAADFARARAAGFHTVAHAGETTGPQTVRDSLDLLGAERIGHGLRAIEDPVLVARLAERGVPLELCPTSNARTGVVPSLAVHPFPALDTAGVTVTLNSDDPPLFGTTLTEEYRLLVHQWGYGADDLERIVLNGVDASFLPPGERVRRRTSFEAEFAALRAELGLPPRDARERSEATRGWVDVSSELRVIAPGASPSS